ncbi:MAG: hypothetical protein R3C24_05570 [Cyanobacteriota/Melainabacteria group bacterium]
MLRLESNGEKLAFGQSTRSTMWKHRLQITWRKRSFGSTSQGSVEQRLSRLEQKLGGQGLFKVMRARWIILLVVREQLYK